MLFPSPDGRLEADHIASGQQSHRQVVSIRERTAAQPLPGQAAPNLATALQPELDELVLRGSKWHMSLPQPVRQDGEQLEWSDDTGRPVFGLTYATRALTGGHGPGLQLLVVDATSFSRKFYALMVDREQPGRRS